MNEIWKDINGYEGLYQVSNLGRIKSFKKSAKLGKPEEYILKPSVIESGYQNVTLYKNKKRKKYLIHRLVALAFIPNPNNLPHINHIDENVSNNKADNLEWCTPLYNNCYGTAKYRKMFTVSDPIDQCLINGVVIASYRTPRIAQEITGISRKEISACVRGDLVSAGGFVWTKSLIFDKKPFPSLSKSSAL